MTIEPDPLYPLSKFYRKDKHPLPQVEFIHRSEIPEPYNSLLDHTEDMTSVLQRFHGKTIRLNLIKLFEEDGRILREVVLVDEHGRSVEFGAIEIHLMNFPPLARDLIRASVLPLGAIIQQNSVSYISRPKTFLKVRSDSVINRVFDLSNERILFGRTNLLTGQENKPLAEVVEILPPMENPD